MIGHAALGLASTILLAVSIAFLFFVILAGDNITHNHTPFRHTYFLKADTSNIEGARSISQWTYFSICGNDNKDCGHAHPAPPFGSAWASDASGAPAALLGSHGGHTTSRYYFYLWRFGWVFYLMGLFFDVIAFFTSFLACCGRLGAGLSSLAVFAAFFFLSIAASLMTATFVKARNVFHRDNRDASIGSYAFGFTWGAVAALFLALMLLCMGTASRKKPTSGDVSGGRRSSTRRHRGHRHQASALNTNGNGMDDFGNVDNHNIQSTSVPPPPPASGRRWGLRGFRSNADTATNGNYAKKEFEDVSV